MALASPVPEAPLADIRTFHARNIPEITVDDLFELETLAQNLREQYGVTLQDHWRPNITPADLFELTRAGRT
jgi:hypothetical protein